MNRLAPFTLVLAACSAPAPVASTTAALVAGPGPACVAEAACICSTCASACEAECADPSATDLYSAACKACANTVAPMGCHDEFDACTVENAPVFAPLDCAADYGFAPCAGGYADPPLCSEALTVDCVADGYMQCGPGNVSDMCCQPAAAYPTWVCVVDTSGSGGAGGSP